MHAPQSLLTQYDAALAEAESLVGPLTPAEMAWRESPEHWSVAQCLDHLAKVGRMYAGKIAGAVEHGHRQKLYSEGPFRYGWLETLFLRLTEPPPKLRIKAPRIFRPEAQAVPVNPVQAMAAYRAANRELQALVQRAEGLDWKKLRVGSPASDWIQFSLGIAMAAAVAHERRHIYQMRQIIKAGGLGPNPR